MGDCTQKAMLKCIIALTEPDLELIKANILTQIHNDYINK